MTEFGQVIVLVAFIAAGFSAFCALAGWRRDHRGLRRCGVVCAVVSVAALSAAIGLLVWALAGRDFHFDYVVKNAGRGLPWYYAVSALWVGQGGSLLLWAWLTGLVILAYRFLARRDAASLAEPAFGMAMAYLCFLVAVMVFGADPMEPSVGSPGDGLGLSPLLEHPAMLIHPPVVFLGYACWTMPFVLAAAALVTGQLGAGWMRQARPWALLGWIALGAGIVFGAQWAYEELGWGGYWNWDPVENASLIPWLCGTAFLHTSMAWRQKGTLKRATLLLASATFGLCNFAAFLTRSGIFSSLHAFSRSPIGWMFLVLMAGLTLAAVTGVALRRRALLAESPIGSIWARESLVAISSLALLLLAGIVLLGTLAAPLSGVFGRTIVVGGAFYDGVLVPLGLLLIAATATAPLARWGAAPTRSQKTAIGISLAAGCVAAVLAWIAGVGHAVALAVVGLAVFAVAAIAGALVLDASRRLDRRRTGRRGTVPLFARLFARNLAATGRELLRALRDGRRQYAGFLTHLGFALLAVGVAGSSLGSLRHETALREGETTQWQGRSIRLAALSQRILPDRLTAEAQIDVSSAAGSTYSLRPAHHLHRLQNEWTTDVAMHSTWAEDFYVILHSREPSGAVNLTFLVNPMVRWIWFGACLSGLGAFLALIPVHGRAAAERGVAPPHWARDVGSDQASAGTCVGIAGASAPAYRDRANSR